MRGIYDANKEGALRWLKRLREASYPPHYEEAYAHFISHVEQGGIPFSDLGTKKDELKEIKKRCYMNSALLTLEFMSKDPQHEDSLLHQMRLQELERDMLKGGFTEDDLRQAGRSKRTVDHLNKPQQYKLPPMPPRGTPEFDRVVARSLSHKKEAIKNVERILSGKLNATEYAYQMKYLRINLRAGFTEEELGGGSFFTLEDLGTTRNKLDECNPDNKKQGFK